VSFDEDKRIFTDGFILKKDEERYKKQNLPKSRRF
jgi:hypothetical protein